MLRDGLHKPGHIIGLPCPLFTILYPSLNILGHDLTGIAVESTNPVSAYVTTMTFGALAIQVLSGRLHEPNMQYSQIISNLHSGPWDQVTLSIWPTQHEPIVWPPSIGLSGEAGLQAFHERWKSSQID